MDKKKKNKDYLINIILVLIVAGITIYICINTLHLGNVEYTDNAQIKRHVTPVNSRIQGYIKEIYFNEYQTVHKGDTLILIEDTEYRLMEAQAEADLQKVLAGKSATFTSLQTAENNLHVSEANIEESRIKMENSKVEFSRYQKLLEKNAVTREQYDNVKAAYNMAKARYEMLVHQKQSAAFIKDEHTHQVTQSNAFVKLAQSQLDMARLNLSYTVILSPSDGVAGRKNIQNGQYIQGGQTLVDIVDSNEMWVTAFYKESQIANITEGQHVKIQVDAFPDYKFSGFVRSISDATGATFSVIPQDNSTGNFVKVQQRIPVRIEFSKENNQEYINSLRAGMNVECLVEY